MSEQDSSTRHNDAHPAPRRNPGYAALSVMGWIELGVSVVLFFADIYPAAMVFAFASILLGFIANQVRFNKVDYRGHVPRPRADSAPADPQQARRSRLYHALLLALSGGLLLLSGFFILNRAGMQAFLAALWAVALAVLAARFRDRTL